MRDLQNSWTYRVNILAVQFDIVAFDKTKQLERLPVCRQFRPAIFKSFRGVDEGASWRDSAGFRNPKW